MSLSTSARRPLSSRCASAPCRTTCAAHERACAESYFEVHVPLSESRIGAKARSAASARSTSACFGRGVSAEAHREASNVNTVHACAIPALNRRHRRRCVRCETFGTRFFNARRVLPKFSKSASRSARRAMGAAKHARLVSCHRAMPPGRSRSKARAACVAAASSASALASAAFFAFLCSDDAFFSRVLFFPKKEAPNVVVVFVAPPSPDDDAPSPPSRGAAEVCLAASARRSSGVLTLRRAAASFPSAAAAAAAASSSSWSSSENSDAAAASPRLENVFTPFSPDAGSVQRSKPPGDIASAPSAAHAAATAPASAPSACGAAAKVMKSARAGASKAIAARRSSAAAARVSGRRGRELFRFLFRSSAKDAFDKKPFERFAVEETIAPTVLSAARRTARAPLGDPSADAARSGARRRSFSAAATTPPAAPRIDSAWPLFASLVNASSAPIRFAARNDAPATSGDNPAVSPARSRRETREGAFLSSSANATATSSLTHENSATSFPTKNRFARTFAAVTRTAGPAHPPHVTRSSASSSGLCASFTSPDELRSVVAAVSARSSNSDRWSGGALASVVGGTSAVRRFSRTDKALIADRARAKHHTLAPRSSVRRPRCLSPAPQAVAEDGSSLP